MEGFYCKDCVWFEPSFYTCQRSDLQDYGRDDQASNEEEHQPDDPGCQDFILNGAVDEI